MSKDPDACPSIIGCARSFQIKPSKVLLVPFGSAGDVHPFVGVGLELKRRGHHVVMITNGYFQSLAESAGFEFEAASSAEEFTSVLDDPALWHPTRALPHLAKISILPQIRPIFELVKKHYRPGETVMAFASLAFGARIAEEKLGIPAASIHLQPSIFKSVYDPPTYPAFGRLPEWLPVPVRRGFFRLVDFAADSVFAGAINQFRSELGLKPVNRVLHQWWHSPRRIIGLFPDWFASPQPDWPPQTKLSGFVLYDGKGLEPGATGVENFMKAGEAPIVFTPGSANKISAGFFRESVETCKLLGRRGLLLTRFPEQIPKNLPATIAHFDYAPFSQVLLRAAAFVHHGGIGTTAQGLRAGVPQLLTPLSYDQPDNAMRVERLGVGTSLFPKRYKAAEVAAILRKLISSTEIQANCQSISEKLDGPTAINVAADLIEELPKIHT